MQQQVPSRTFDLTDDDTSHRDSNSKTFELTTKACVGCNHAGVWRIHLNKWVCRDCLSSPEYKTICRSTAKDKYGLTWHQLVEGYKQGHLQMFTVTNPHAKYTRKDQRHRVAPMRLYYEREVKQFANDLATKKIKLQIPV